MMDQPLRSPEARPLELHLLHQHDQFSDDLMQLEDMSLAVRHAQLHEDGASHEYERMWEPSR